MEQHSDSIEALIPLRKWMEGENQMASGSHRAGAGIGGEGNEIGKHTKKEVLLRKTTIAYGLAELLTRARSHYAIDPSSPSGGELFGIDNFVVRLTNNSQQRWEDIIGVGMLSPPIPLYIVEPSFLRDGHSEGGEDVQDQVEGRYLEVEFPTLPEAGAAVFAISQSEEDARCHSLGKILHELFSHPSPFFSDEYFTKKDPKSVWTKNENMQKKPRLLEESQQTPYHHLIDLGLPPSTCLLVQNLLDCGGCDNDSRPEDAYDSLETVSKDLHLLLLDPNRFLFDREPMPENENVTLSFREHKLYGREREVSLITDAFCRVSEGKSEAFFIAGFSGSGKSRLVNSLTARVDVVEGYVLTHKFDQMSKERLLLEVISVFNDLCLLIKEKRSQNDLVLIAQELIESFSTDYSMLARLLPNVKAISPRSSQGYYETENKSDGQMNLRSVCFILQRFMRAVSSKAHPVMIFLDDLQWCNESSALALVEGILCDANASSCLFFVGSYRSNEVQDDHAIFSHIDALDSSGVPTTKLSLGGLNPEDLNIMVSDATCMFPRICEPLSDILFQKTKGNPFFVLEFLRSLVDGDLLKYSIEKRRWAWDEDRISSTDVTGNVLHLLSSKMSSLSENIQLALKVAACFGTKVKESIVGYLNTNPEYPNVQSGFELVVAEGYMIKIGAYFKFVHDKIREAAYRLIPDGENKQYHYNLGMALYLLRKGCDVDDIIFSIADQVNHGIDDSLVQNSELRLEFVEINKMAGVKAVDCSDYAAARSYLTTALNILPNDHWKSNYDKSKRLCFLLAKSTYLCGDFEKAQSILKEILSEAHCLTDKLDAYDLLGWILFDREAAEEAYRTFHDVLLQLGESIPSAFSLEEANAMIETTSKMSSSFSEESLLGMKEMEKTAESLLKFYSNISGVSFAYKPNMVPFFSCRMVQLTRDRGLCKYSLIGFAQYAVGGSNHKTIPIVQEACRIGKLAMAILEQRFNSSADIVASLYFSYYGFSGTLVEPLQSCANCLYRGFECGMACGDTFPGFANSLNSSRISLLAGVHLPALLKRIEYFLGVLKSNGGGNMFATRLFLLRDTVSALLGNDCNDGAEENSAENSRWSLYYKALGAFWLGHHARCNHMFGRLFESTDDASWGSRHRDVILYYGITVLKLIKRTSTKKMKAIPRDALEMLKISASFSKWNFCNKAQLMEAEIFSYEGKNKEAKKSYAVSVESARRFGFIHEQGLALELQALHFKKVRDKKRARDCFSQAKQCYVDWGNQMKVDIISRQLDSLQNSN